jgi:hypothetical protein
MIIYADRDALATMGLKVVGNASRQMALPEIRWPVEAEPSASPFLVMASPDGLTSCNNQRKIFCDTRWISAEYHGKKENKKWCRMFHKH